MRSRGDRAVKGAERIARVTALVLIAWALWRVLMPHEDAARTVRIESPLRGSLAVLSIAARMSDAPPARTPETGTGASSGPTPVHVALTTLPDVVERDWLVALRRAGSPISWSDAGLGAATAVTASRAADPIGVVTIAVGARDSATLQVHDALGVIDSLPAAPPGARITAPMVHERITIQSGGRTLAGAAAPGERILRPLLVLGSAGWESKFIIAALEERGWTVHSRIRVSPTATAIQGAPLPIDTARYGAVLLLDSRSNAPAAQLARYVRSGGGLIVAGDAVRDRALASIVPARAGALVPGSLLRSASAGGREGLPHYPLLALRADAVTIDARDSATVVAARREGAGRIVMVGETDSWRWRMSGGTDAPAEHREWWSRVVASAAYAPTRTMPAADPDAAPYAALVDALGDPVRDVAASAPDIDPALPWWMGVAILLLLLAEWSSRRLRGER